MWKNKRFHYGVEFMLSSSSEMARLLGDIPTPYLFVAKMPHFRDGVTARDSLIQDFRLQGGACQ